jgi:hypothetical protein
MKNTWKRLNYLGIGTWFAILGATVLFIAPDAFSQVRDPFAKPIIVTPKSKVVKPVDPISTPIAVRPVKPPPPQIVPLSAPPVEARLEQYKLLKKMCAERGITCPKPTSVLTMEEIEVTGIFYSPRGYSAMVEAKPINLSYVIYPGEKFFNGQLVAIEEGRLVFRKVTKLSNGKLITVAENMAIRREGGDSLKSSVEAAKAAGAPLQIASNDLPVMNLPVPKPEKPETTKPAATENGEPKTPTLTKKGVNKPSKPIVEVDEAPKAENQPTVTKTDKPNKP